MTYVQHEEDELEQKRLHCECHLTFHHSHALTFFKTPKSSMHSRVRLTSSTASFGLVITPFLVVACLLNDSSLVKGYTICLPAQAPTRKGVAPPGKRRKPSEPVICLEDYNAHVDDVDEGDNGCWDFHAARCLIQ